MLKELVDKVDCIAMDIKTDLDNYEDVVGFNLNVNRIKKSVEIIKITS